MLAVVSTLTGFERILLYIAVPFSILTVIQLVIQFVVGGHDVSASGADIAVGGGADTDTGVSHHGFSIFTIGNLTYFLTMFGWAGLAASKSGAGVGFSLTIATAAGLLTTVIVAYIFFSLNRLTETGNVQLANAAGSSGTVYLHIPAKRSGTGLIQLTVQGQTVEMNALTDGDALKTGTPVKVEKVLDGDVALVVKSN